MYIVVWWGGYESPNVAFRYSLVEAQKRFDEWSADCPDGETVTLYRVDPESESTYELQEYAGSLPF